ncbi:MAG: hypothetical protein PVI86_15080 [Phycisphaerae bacterium]|jgi:hypothetical protein
MTVTGARVRQNAGSAAIAAVLMIYFGFYVLAGPSGGGLFGLAGLLFYHTLRIGGVVMALVAVWSLAGHRVVLLVDGVASSTIGALLMLSAVGMVVGGGAAFDGLLYVVFGVMFISAGIRSGRHYFALGRASEARPSGELSSVGRSEGPIGGEPETRDSGGARVWHSQDPVASSARADEGTSRSVTKDGGGSSAEASGATSDPPEPGQPGDGFLASFADEDPPPRI